MCRHPRIYIEKTGYYRKNKFCIGCARLLIHRNGKYLLDLKKKHITYRMIIKSLKALNYEEVSNV